MSDFFDKLPLKKGEEPEEATSPEKKPPSVSSDEIDRMAKQAFSRKPSDEYVGGGVLVQDDSHLDVDDDDEETDEDAPNRWSSAGEND